MEDIKTQTAAAESASQVTRLSIYSGIAGVVLGLLVLILGMLKSDFAGSDTFMLAMIPLALVILFSIANFIYGLLAGSAAEEAVEKVLLAKRKESHALNVEEDVRFTAERSFASFGKYAPYVVGALGAIVTLGLDWLFWRHFSIRLVKPLPISALQAAFVSVVMMLACVMMGAFYIGQARAGGYRWLRSSGSWLIMAFFTFILAAAVSLCNKFGMPEVDAKVADFLLVVYLILGVEFVINFIIEFYRPRTIIEDRPVFESRLLALFTEPGGVMRNIADMLDYQFGFKVSGTWIYSFIERSLYPLLVFWVAILWLSTCIYEVGPNEVGFRTSFGKASQELLDSGVYLGMPWPFGAMDTYSTTEIHQVLIGGHAEDEEAEEEVEDDGHGHAKPQKAPKRHYEEVITWTNSHAENPVFFALADDSRLANNADQAMQLSLINLAVPVQYRIRRDGVFQYANGIVNAPEMLKVLSESVLAQYLAGTTLHQLLASDRLKTERYLHEQIQKTADAQNLGVEIIAVTLLDIHPPVKEVAPSFEAVVSKMEEARTMKLAAQTRAAQLIPAAESDAARIVAEARSYSTQAVAAAKSESYRFGAQLQAYNAMPEMFKLRTYLEFLERDCAGIRKYILGGDLKAEVYDLNFEKSPQLRLLDTGINEIKREQ